MFKKFYINAIDFWAFQFSSPKYYISYRDFLVGVAGVVALLLSKDVTAGTRVFILSTERDESVPSMYRSRVEGVIAGALAQTKFDIVYQPFLKEETIKRVESTDSTFKVSNQSSYKMDYGSMRTLLDTMKEYSIDLLLASHLYLSHQYGLILDVWLIDSKTLELKQTYRVYSASIENRMRDKAEVQISALHGTAAESYISREYGNSQALTIGPELEQIFVDGARLSIIQPILRSSNIVKGGFLLGFENTYLKNLQIMFTTLMNFKFAVFP